MLMPYMYGLDDTCCCVVDVFNSSWWIISIYYFWLWNSPLLLENVALRMGNLQVTKASRMLAHVS